jgi:hypothetical protein
MKHTATSSNSGTLQPEIPPAQPTRGHVLARMLALCMTSVVMVLGGNLMLALPQIREGLWAFDDGGDGTWRRQAWLVLAYLFWATTTWYVARLTLGRRFPNDSVGADRPYVHGIAKWLPRLLALAACQPLALFTAGTGRHAGLAAVLLATSLAFLAFTWNRRVWMARFRPGIAGPLPQGYYRYFDRLSPGSWLTIAAGLLLSHLVLVAIMVSPITASRAIGAPALMLLAIGSWTLVAGLGFSYLPRTWGWVTLGWVPLVLFVAFSYWNDSHPVDWASGPRLAAARATNGPVDRPALQQHYVNWMDRHADRAPVFLVASAGGASRASYWSGVLLGRMEDEARAASKDFGRNIFMLSGISGGSVGIAAYAAALRAWPPQAREEPARAGSCFRLAMDQFLGADVLAPVGAMMLFPEMWLQVLPPVLNSQPMDRSRGLEEAWSTDWKSLMDRPPKGCAKTARDVPLQWTLPFNKVLQAQAGQPAVVLNTVRLEDSRRVLQSNVRLDLRDAEDLFVPGFEERVARMSLAGAAHNSARFPLVSPPGSVRTAKNQPWGHLGDGGYHEVTGATTVADVLQALIALGCVRRDPGGHPATRLLAKKHCDGQTSPKDDSMRADESPIVVVMLDNVPTDFPENWQRGPDGQTRGWGNDEAGRTSMARAHTRLQPIEVLGPVWGLLTHSSQEGRSAVDRLAMLAGSDPHAWIELRQPRYSGLREPSMNWQLDVESRKLMMCATEDLGRPVRPLLSVPTDAASCSGRLGILPRPERKAANLADAALISSLQRLRGWILHQNDRSGSAAPATQR